MDQRSRCSHRTRYMGGGVEDELRLRDKRCAIGVTRERLSPISVPLRVPQQAIAPVGVLHGRGRPLSFQDVALSSRNSIPTSSFCTVMRGCRSRKYAKAFLAASAR